MKNLLTTILAATISFGGATAIQQKNQYDTEQEIQRLHALIYFNKAMIAVDQCTSQEGLTLFLEVTRLWETSKYSDLFGETEVFSGGHTSSEEYEEEHRKLIEAMLDLILQVNETNN